MKSLLRFILLFFVSTPLLFSQCPPGSDTDSDGDGVQDCIDPCTDLPNSLVGNLSFESDFIGWTIPQNSGSFSINQDAQNTLDGTNALYVTAPNDTQFENYAIYSEEFTLEEGVGYSFRIPAKRIGNNDGDALRWALVDENGVYRHLNNYYDWTTDWSTISFDNFLVNFSIYSSNRFRLRLEFGLSTTDMVVDKIEFYETAQGFDPAYQDLDSDGQPDCGSIDVSNLTDYNALLELYNSTNGANWSNNTNWLNTGAPLNTWHGITTTNINGEERVSQINLEYNNLNGTIPDSIGDLTYLSLLNLQVNQLNGAIPDEIGNLSNLTFLRLNTNSLSGTIPTSIGNLTNLNYLILAVNNLTGGIPTEISNLSSLFWLILGNNPLGGSIPPGLGNLGILGILDLRANDLTGSIPPELGNLSNLFQLFLFFNDLSGTIPTELGNLTNLNNVSFNGNNLEGNIPAGFSNFTNLQFLNLADNSFGGTLPDFSSQPLDLLWIQNNRFTFADFENEFATYQNNINDFQYAPQANRFISSSTISCENNICLPTANDVSLTFPMGGNNTTYQWYKNGLPMNGETSSTIEIIDFSTNDIGSYFCIASNTVITGLTIYSDTLTISQPASQSPDYDTLVQFYNTTQGQFWNNNTNWLDGSKPLSSWHGITETNGRVTGLDLVANNMFGNLPESLFNLTELNFLRISSNFMNGELPAELGNLQNLTYLDLSWNQFEGTIPATLTNLSNLYALVLSGNNLSGTIPDFTSSTNGSLDFFYINNNQFVFADFEAQFPTYNTNLGANFIISPQQFIDINKGVSANIGETVTLETLPNLGSNLTVDWYDGITFAYLGTGETFDVIINSENDYGEFLYFVTSASVSGLGLQSRNIVVGPGPTSHPDYDALLAVFNALDGTNWDRPWNVTAPIETWDANATFDEIVFDGTTNRVSSLTLNGPDKSGNIPTEIGDLSELTYLNIGSINITGSIPTSIGNLSNLTELWLTSNDLSGEVPSEIWNLSNLVNLLIGIQANNQLTLPNGIPTNISNLQNLEWLNLNGIPLSQPLQPELFNLPSLIRLRVQDCGLSGQLPSGFANISDIFADRNDFSGTIPSEILNVTNNNRLSITNNLFDFSDLEPLAMSNGYNFLDYSPQRTLDVEESLESGVGTDITLNVNDTNIDRNEVITATNNQYQWFKDNLAITGANDTSYTITNAQEEDSGIYFCRITNPLLPDLIIDRAPITLLVDSALNIIDEDKIEFSIYPNPAQNWINIKGDFSTENTVITVYDFNGRQMLKQHLESNINSVNIENLQNGRYILEIRNAINRQTAKFIKQ